jgi:signal transduction histidine kinase
MGRLFWKFFFFSWLAQLAGIVGIGAVFWLTEARSDRSSPAIDASPAAGPPAGRPGAPLDAGGPRAPPPHNLPLVPIVATVLTSLVTALALAWYVARPIRSLRIAFDTAAAGNLEWRVAPLIGGRHDELADLGRDFDRMAERLKAAMAAQRRLLHDVSHEMRSPLARLQTAAGLIRLKYGRDDPVTDRLEEEIVRIDRLLGELLKLSRFEAGELPGVEEAIDMRDLVREVIADASFEAKLAQRDVRFERQVPAIVAGRPELLHGAIENIVRNALKHAPATPLVEVDSVLDAAGTHYVLRVLDSGPGVPESELARLFTPFFRAAGAASTDGHGLGLAIARRCIEAHRGTVTAGNRPEGGFVVTVTLPLASVTPASGVQAG